jgi:Uma2 family endonuclease
MPVQLWRGKFREPDVMFYRAEHLARIGEQYATSPDWVAEVLSPSTRDMDLFTKIDEYALAGIPEYWLVDPEAQVVAVYTLAEGAETYHLVAEYHAGQHIQAQTLEGLALSVDELFKA